VHFVRLDFLVRQRVGLGEQGWVAHEVLAPDGLVERVAGSPVDVMRGSRGQAGGLHLGVQAFQVLWFEPVQPVGAKAGDQVLLDVDAIAVVRVWCDSWRDRDGIEPMREPPGDSEPFARLANRTAVAISLELAHLLGNGRFGRSSNVPTIGFPVVPVRRLAWHAVAYQGNVAFPGRGLHRLSCDLATGSAGVLLVVRSALQGGPIGLPFLTDHLWGDGTGRTGFESQVAQESDGNEVVESMPSHILA
jgi:hypothetical protein